MSPGQDTTTVPSQSWAATLLWSALVAAFSAADWLIWLSWADEQPELATWQIAGVELTLLAGATVGLAYRAAERLSADHCTLRRLRCLLHRRQ